MLDPELAKALELVAEFDLQRTVVTKEYRLYYNEDGTIIGLWESDFPEGNYIVLESPDEFHRVNTQLIRIVDNKITMLNPKITAQTYLSKSETGQPVVKGHAALALNSENEYSSVEHYDNKTNS
jgi:hypothetical protein